LGDLFEVNTVKGLDEGKLNLKLENDSGYFEFIGRTRNSNGIKGYVKKLNIEPNPENVISISQIGTIVAQLRKVKWYGSQNIFSLATKSNFQNLVSLFTVSELNRVLDASYSAGYSNYPTLEKLKNLAIQLPIHNGQIDFEFMESFVAELEAERVAELEAERVAELEAYLQATGLKDYTLSVKEKQVLTDFEKGEFEWGEFRFNSIFDNIKQGRRLKKDDQKSGNIPFVMAGVTNTGIVNYISNPVVSFPKNSITIDIFGNTFYRNYPFGAGDDTGVYWNIEKEHSKEKMLFFATSMERSLFGKFSYGKKLRSSQSLDFKMILPTKNNQPDYETMETLISAIQKLVIKDVVLYSDRKIEATKNVVNKI
jgi:hypothetical protein